MNINEFEIKNNCYIEVYDNSNSSYFLNIGFDKTEYLLLNNTFFNKLLDIFGAKEFIIREIGDYILTIQLLKTVETIG